MCLCTFCLSSCLPSFHPELEVFIRNVQTMRNDGKKCYWRRLVSGSKSSFKWSYHHFAAAFKGSRALITLCRRILGACLGHDRSRIVLQCMCVCLSICGLWMCRDHVIPPPNRFFINLERMVKCQRVHTRCERGILSSCYCHLLLNNANISEFEPVVDVNTENSQIFYLTFQRLHHLVFDLIFL